MHDSKANLDWVVRDSKVRERGGERKKTEGERDQGGC